MIAAEVIDALDLIEQDHRLVLDKVRALKEAVSLLLHPGDVSLTEVLDRLQRLNEFFATKFTAHMQEEEATLFPFLERHTPGGPALVAGLRRQHAEIQRKREEFANCLEVADGLEGGPPKMVLRDLLGYGWELWDLLDSHAADETRAVYRCFARTIVNGAAAK